MSTQLPKPFTIDEIQKYPKAVVIALLIGMLLLFGSVISFLFVRKEDDSKECEREKKELYDLIIKERNERIVLYEEMIFFKNNAEKWKAEAKDKDSIFKSKTQILVEEILNKK